MEEAPARCFRPFCGAFVQSFITCLFSSWVFAELYFSRVCTFCPSPGESPQRAAPVRLFEVQQKRTACGYPYDFVTDFGAARPQHLRLKQAPIRCDPVRSLQRSSIPNCFWAKPDIFGDAARKKPRPKFPNKALRIIQPRHPTAGFFIKLTNVRSLFAPPFFLFEFRREQRHAHTPR